MKIIISQPETKKEFEEYYNLRYKILRKPWNKPKGSEKDGLEGKSFHIIALSGEKIVGAGRLHFNSREEVQVRYMAVDEDYQGEGIGGKILNELEREARRKGAGYVVLNARENAVNFYKKHGYRIIEEGQLLFGSIKQFKMRKEI